MEVSHDGPSQQACCRGGCGRDENDWSLGLNVASAFKGIATCHCQLVLPHALGFQRPVGELVCRVHAHKGDLPSYKAGISTGMLQYFAHIEHRTISLLVQ